MFLRAEFGLVAPSLLSSHDLLIRDPLFVGPHVLRTYLGAHRVIAYDFHNSVSRCSNPCLVDEEIKAPKLKINCLKSHGLQVTLKPKPG